MNKLRSLLILLTLSFSIIFFSIAPVYAGTMDVTGFTTMTGNCTASVTMFHNFFIQGTTDDTGTGRDAIALVLYDGHGDAFAYIGIGVNVGFSGTITNWGWFYPILVQPKSRPFTMKIFDNTTPIGTGLGDLAGAQHGTIVDVHVFDPAPYGVCKFLPFLAPPEASLQPNFSDGRINNWDVAAPVVVYGQDFENGRGLAVYSPQGELLLVHPDEIAAVPECPLQNTVIANGDKIGLYRLANCHYQINAPTLDGAKTYVLIFDAFFANTGYHSHEE
jgi:hypothetical protein